MAQAPLPVTLHPLAPQDTPAILAFHIAAITQVCARDYTPEEIAAWVANRDPTSYLTWQSRGDTFLVARTASGQPVGFICWNHDTIQGLFVAPAFHGRGIGSTLLHAAEAACNAAGHHLRHVGSTLTARTFYEAHGFQVQTLTTKTFNGTPVREYRMTRP